MFMDTDTAPIIRESVRAGNQASAEPAEDERRDKRFNRGGDEEQRNDDGPERHDEVAEEDLVPRIG